MAFTNTVSYSGKASFDFFSPALYNNDMLKLFTVIDGVKNSINLPQVSLSGLTTTDACGFTDAGNIALAPRVLTTCSYKINKEICASDLEPGFLSERLRAGSWGAIAPSEFTDYLIDLMTETISNDVQNLMWGATGTCSGILYELGATGGTTFSNGVVGVTAAAGVTAGNVIVELGKVYSAVPNNVMSTKKVVMIVSQEIASAYALAQANVSGGLFMVGQKELNFLGVPMFVAPYLPARRMLALDPANIVIGVDMLDDTQEIKVIDVSDTLGYNAVRLVARWKFGVKTKINAEIVYYA